MIVVTVEVWPKGNEEKKYLLTRARVTNIGGNTKVANYQYVLEKHKYAKSPEGVWKTGQIEDFPRQAKGMWDLLYHILRHAVGYRNRD